jgi:hypothetical protein
MTKEILLARVQELGKAVNESLENHQRLKVALDNATNAHNALIGRFDEARYLHAELEKLEKKEPPKAK